MYEYQSDESIARPPFQAGVGPLKIRYRSSLKPTNPVDPTEARLTDYARDQHAARRTSRARYRVGTRQLPSRLRADECDMCDKRVPTL